MSFTTELMFTDYIKSYVDNGIQVPNYIKDVVKSSGLNPIEIYHIGCDYLRKGLVKYAKPILASVNVSLA